jgi:transcriptional regulator of acetoin/glycerol metabolism
MPMAEQMFSRPENDRRVMLAWERFQQDPSTDPSSMRSLIDDSWRRCQLASVDPGQAQAPISITGGKLYQLRDQCAELLGASTPVMAQARTFLSETGTVMVLTDTHGTVLSMEGDLRTLGAAENVHLLAGANWSEGASGTNAIGTTLSVGQPVQIHSAEHYCEGIKRWSCSATVIRDSLDGTPLGSIDVSGLTDSYSRHTLALVVSTAARIESRLAQTELDLRYSLLETCVHLMNDQNSDGVILFDRRGRAIKANHQAAEMLIELERNNVGLSGLRLPDIRITGDDQSLVLPKWAQRDHLEPVLVDGKQVGALLTMPNWQRKKGVFVSLSAMPTEDLDTSFERVVGRSAAIRSTVSRARQLAKSRVPVLLTGETGVGKEVFARGIHEAHSNAGGPFVALNCGGFSRELLSSELFGHAEGSFTGAKRGGMIGKIEAANGGTLFLDEIGEMPMDLQPNFLRVLEEGEVYRLGENKPRKVSFRLVAATHRDLRKEIRDGNFRMDLFYRIAVTSIHIPPLRERPEDIPLLFRHYVAQLSRRHGLDVKEALPGVMAALQRYAWPGNVRELRNAVESMLLTASGAVLTEADLPPELLHAACAVAPAPNQGSPDARGLTRLETAEREALVGAMHQCKGNMTAVARHLGVAKSTVYLKLKRFDLEALVDELRVRSSLS